MKLLIAIYLLASGLCLPAAALHSPRGAELFAATPRRSRPPAFVARYLPLPLRLIWSHEEMGNGRVGFVVESATNQVDWIERARLAAPPFVFVPNQSAEFFRVAAQKDGVKVPRERRPLKSKDLPPLPPGTAYTNEVKRR